MLLIDKGFFLSGHAKGVYRNRDMKLLLVLLGQVPRGEQLGGKRAIRTD